MTESALPLENTNAQLLKDRRIAIIAGCGGLPAMCVQGARRQGAAFVGLIGLSGECAQDDKFSNSLVDAFSAARVGQFSKILLQLQSWNVSHCIMVGGVSRARLFRTLLTDLLAIKVIARAGSLRDDAILRAISDEIESNGIKVIGAAAVLKEALLPEGVFVGKVSADDLKDIEIGVAVARKLGALDVGQAVAVKDGVVVAVEAAEGTDAMIERAGRISGGGFIVTKVSKPQQDLRLDLPTVGATTIELLTKFGARGLVVEAAKTLVVEPETVVKLASTAGIFIYVVI